MIRPNTLAENIRTWETFDWDKAQGGDSWSHLLFGSVDAHWNFSIRPRINRFLPANAVCEIAPGFGRWTQYLLRECDSLVGVDLAARCVNACRRRFQGNGKAKFVKNDGLHLFEVDRASIDFVFSMDSLVHCDLPVITSYIAEVLRVLKPHGRAFLHHSNLDSVPAAKGGKVQWRAPDVSANAVRDIVARSGGYVYSQEVINWLQTPYLIDCFTIFGQLPGSYRRIENPNYTSEGDLVRKVGNLYCFDATQ